MEKIETYADVKFLVDFCSNLPSNVLDNKYYKWAKIFETLSKKCLLIIDSKDNLLKGINNPAIKHLIKLSSSGGSEIIEYEEYFNMIKDDEKVILNINNVSSIFCLSRTKINNRCGFFVSSFEECYKKFSLINTEINPISVSRGKDNQFKSWSNYFNNTPPLNSIIIADNYILDKTETFDKNLFAILDAIVPKYRIDETIDISIIVQKDLTNPEKRYDIIENFLKIKDNNFNLNIHLTPKDKPHDRIIISNYFYVTSGHSLDFFNAKGNINKETTLNYFPICSIKSIKSFYKEISKLSEYTKNNRFIGNNSNRILDYHR